MNKDQAQGRIEEVIGKVKEFAGKVTGNTELAKKGKMQNTNGYLQAEYGDLKENLRKTIPS